VISLYLIALLSFAFGAAVLMGAFLIVFFRDDVREAWNELRGISPVNVASDVPLMAHPVVHVTMHATLSNAGPVALHSHQVEPNFEAFIAQADEAVPPLEANAMDYELIQAMVRTPFESWPGSAEDNTLSVPEIRRVAAI
jgi:hypothetical protein